MGLSLKRDIVFVVCQPLSLSFYPALELSIAVCQRFAIGVAAAIAFKLRPIPSLFVSEFVSEEKALQLPS
jgi:hypothetical protein